MFNYDSQLIISISIRIVAIICSIILLCRIKDWRISLLTLMLLLMAFQQSMRFFGVMNELPGFIVSILALLVTVSMGRLLAMQKQDKERLREINERLEQRVLERTAELEKTNQELTDALSHVKTLSGMLPICASCKKIRNDTGYWEQIEQYIGNHSEALFTHAICPDCGIKLYPEHYDKVWGKEDK